MPTTPTVARCIAISRSPLSSFTTNSDSGFSTLISGPAGGVTVERMSGTLRHDTIRVQVALTMFLRVSCVRENIERKEVSLSVQRV